MKYWQVILASIVLFGSGMASGYFLGLRKAAADVPVADETPVTKDERAPWTRDRSLRHFVHFLEEEIQINEDQKDQILQIVQESNEKMKQIWDDVRPKAAEQMSRTNEKIKAVLSDEQVERFDKAMDEFRKRRFQPRGRDGDGDRDRDGRRGPPPPNWDPDRKGPRDWPQRDGDGPRPEWNRDHDQPPPPPHGGPGPDGPPQDAGSPPSPDQKDQACSRPVKDSGNDENRCFAS
jgi:hypothetical protein